MNLSQQIIELCEDVDESISYNNLSPDQREALENATSSNKTFQEFAGLTKRNKQYLYDSIAQRNITSAKEIIRVIKSMLLLGDSRPRVGLSLV